MLDRYRDTIFNEAYSYFKTIRIKLKTLLKFVSSIFIITKCQNKLNFGGAYFFYSVLFSTITVTTGYK